MTLIYSKKRVLVFVAISGTAPKTLGICSVTGLGKVCHVNTVQGLGKRGEQWSRPRVIGLELSPPTPHPGKVGADGGTRCQGLIYSIVRVMKPP